ncbi:hypothetical protein LTR37_013913 [Vermiconidia calcicola]|uniref:Uncharacterized protein n=1 Tax=Vermiconidia calcicola TaxID=1690605 RepID=A0ACC3MV54_9PEZI|nr:hypothetical protein LTR37_013913 [Vermiconidia calcicola]
MPSAKPAKTGPSTAQSINSIDSVLATPPAKPAGRPLAKLRPSWIGPPRSSTPGATAMKQHVIVEYSSPGLQPPVYIFTSLSDPQWDAVEMQAEKTGNSEYRFFRTFDVEEGEYQYKFRLGPGDWWVCDESKPTVDDGAGNKNNLLVTKAPHSVPDMPVTERIDKKTGPSPTVPKPAAISIPKAAPQAHAVETPAADEVMAPVPLLKHETFAPQRKQPSSDVDDEYISDDDEGYDSVHTPPLLRHESLVPSSAEQTHAPLFRHESIALGYNHHEQPAARMTPTKNSRRASPASPIPDEADPNDPTLEKFPTNHAGIIEKIHRTSLALAADETIDDVERDSPLSQAMSETSISAPSLPSVREADDEELEKIREMEEEEYEREEASDEEMDPLKPSAPITPPLTPKEPDDNDFEPKVGKPELEKKVVAGIGDERRSTFKIVLGKLGGRGNAIAVAVGLLVIAAGIASMQLR